MNYVNMNQSPSLPKALCDREPMWVKPILTCFGDIEQITQYSRSPDPSLVGIGCAS
jgi:hypothetical protein